MSAVCDGCGTALISDGAFCWNCRQVAASAPIWAAGHRPVLTPAGAETTHEIGYPAYTPDGPDWYGARPSHGHGNPQPDHGEARTGSRGTRYVDPVADHSVRGLSVLRRGAQQSLEKGYSKM